MRNARDTASSRRRLPTLGFSVVTFPPAALRSAAMLLEKPWKLEALMRFLLGVVAFMMIGSLALRLLPNPGARLPTLVVNTLTFHLGVLIITGVFVREHGLTWHEAFGWRDWSPRRVLVPALLATAGILPLSWMLAGVSAQVMTRFKTEPVQQATVQALQTSVSTSERAVFGIIAIVCAPVIEEILFRGILYPAIKRLGFPQTALWLTALLFALSHANTMTFLPLVLLALLLTWLYERTGNLLTPILAHAAFNLTNFLWLLFERHLRLPFFWPQ